MESLKGRGTNTGFLSFTSAFLPCPGHGSVSNAAKGSQQLGLGAFILHSSCWAPLSVLFVISDFLCLVCEFLRLGALTWSHPQCRRGGTEGTESLRPLPWGLSYTH